MFTRNFSCSAEYYIAEMHRYFTNKIYSILSHTIGINFFLKNRSHCLTVDRPGIVASDGTFSINSLGNSSSNFIVPQNLILAKVMIVLHLFNPLDRYDRCKCNGYHNNIQYKTENS